MPEFDAAHAAVHYPSDRRFHLWVRPGILIGIAVVVAALMAAAWIEYLLVAFFSFGPALYGGAYYDTQSLENVLKAECVLACYMNGERLPAVYGAPLGLRVENQLGYKMVKWIERVEFVMSEKELGAGEGGKNEDDEYFDLLPNI